MNRILSETVSFGRQYLRTKIGPFFAFIFPVLLIVIFGAIFTSSEGSGISLPVQNLDQGPHSATLLAILDSTGYFEISMVAEGEDIVDHINDNSLALALRIPANFSSNIDASTPASVTLYGDMSRSSFPIAQGVLDAVISQMNYDLTGANPMVSFEVQNAGSEQLTAYDFLLPGFIGLTIMVSAMYFMTSICAEHRSRGYFKLLATTTLKKSEWLVSKFIFNSLMLILSLLVTFAVAVTMFDLKAVLTPVAILLVIAGAFMFTSLGMLIGVVVKDPESAAAISNVIGFPMMFLSGSFFPIEMMPGFLQTFARLLPLYYINEGLRASMIFADHMAALRYAAIIGVFAAVVIALGIIATRWEESK